MIIVHYSSTPIVSLTLNAYDVYQVPLYTDVYIDGIDVGTTPITVYIPLGDHSLWFYEPAWDPVLSTYVNVQYIADSSYYWMYGNGANVAWYG